MPLSKLSELYSYGIITDIRAVKDLLNGESGWRLEFTINDDTETQMETALGKLKIYKTFEALIRDVQRVKGRYVDDNEQRVIRLL